MNKDYKWQLTIKIFQIILKKHAIYEDVFKYYLKTILKNTFILYK